MHISGSNSSPSITDDPYLPFEHGEGGLATKLYNTCLQILQSFYQISLARKPLQAHTAILKEELARLTLWGESFRSGKLEQVFAFTEGPIEPVFETFIEIGRLLLGLMNLPGFSEAKEFRFCEGLNASLEQAKLMVVRRASEGDRGTSDNSSDSDSDDESYMATQDFGQLAKWLQTQISQLARIRPAIQRSFVRLEQEEFQSRSACPPVVPFQVSSAAGAYVSLIRDRFKDASSDLVERLGEANWQRHRNIRNVQIDSDIVLGPTPTAIFRPVSTFYDSGLGTSVPDGSYDAQSHTSLLSSNTNDEPGDLRVPLTPREVRLGRPFECFLCKEILTRVRNRVDWKIHVFADLRPYICTFPGCKEELAQFSSRIEWGEHEFKCHRFRCTWRCPDCPETCSKLIDYENHVQSRHGMQQDSVTWQRALDLALEKQENPAELERCPLCCATPGSSRRNFVNHVARHMEQIALAALPRDVEDSDNEEGEMTPESSVDMLSGFDGQSADDELPLSVKRSLQGDTFTVPDPDLEGNDASKATDLTTATDAFEATDAFKFGGITKAVSPLNFDPDPIDPDILENFDFERFILGDTLCNKKDLEEFEAHCREMHFLKRQMYMPSPPSPSIRPREKPTPSSSFR